MCGFPSHGPHTPPADVVADRGHLARGGVAGAPPWDPAAALAARSRPPGLRPGAGEDIPARPVGGFGGGIAGHGGDARLPAEAREHGPGIARAGDRLRRARAPFGGDDRGPLPLLHHGRRGGAVPGLVAVRGRHRVRHPPPRHRRGSLPPRRLQPSRRHRPPLEVGDHPRPRHPRHERRRHRQLAAQRIAAAGDHGPRAQARKLRNWPTWAAGNGNERRAGAGGPTSSTGSWASRRSRSPRPWRTACAASTPTTSMGSAG